MSEAAHVHHPNYIKIWGILIFLLFLSVLGPEIGIKWVTLVAAFGIAVVKAYIVAKNFMHLNVEKRYIVYLFLTALAFMALFFFGVAPDVMKGSGTNWEKPGWDDPAPVVEPSHGEHGAAESGH
ncbi:MAG: cytochrome C oxidase subunit IV family protein [Deltaproteobacteria bacterium]|nr:cytochrome C oxidase subunit IV family protein [Deltaproteobacteria bacterium]